jgi:hypothetical protein
MNSELFVYSYRAFCTQVISLLRLSANDELVIKELDKVM